MAVGKSRDVKKIDTILQTFPGSAVKDIVLSLSLGSRGQLMTIGLFHNKLHYFDSNGKLEVAVDLPADRKHYGLTATKDEDILVCDDRRFVKLLTSGGEFIREFTRVDCVHHVLRYHEGHIYGLERRFCKISIYNMEGELQYSFGSEGGEPGQFKKLHDLCVGPDDYLYVSDSGNSRVQVLERDGTFVKQFVDERVEKPSGIAVTADGYIAVSSTGTCSLSFFSVNGKMVHKVENAEFGTCSNMVIDKDGFIYVNDFRHHRIVKF